MLVAAAPDDLPGVCIVDANDDRAVLDELASDVRYRDVGVVTVSHGSDDLSAADVDLKRPHSLADLEQAVELALTKNPLQRAGTPDGADPYSG
jgi:hypothetical protein